MSLRQAQSKLSKSNISSKTSVKAMTMADLLAASGYKQSLRSSSLGKLGTAGLKIPSGKQGKKNLTMEELLRSTGYKIPSLRRRQEVSGKIVSITPQEILIDIGAKSEGIVTGRELTSVRDLVAGLSVGDQVDAQVMLPESDAGQVVLSLRKLSQDTRWKDLEEKRTDQEDMKVIAMEVNRGGVICDWLGLRGFLPASQLSLPSSGKFQPPSKLENLIGKSLTCRVIEVDRSTNRLIFSQKQLGKKDLESLLKLLGRIKIGQKYSGVVTAVLPFGIFVEINLEEAIRQSGDQAIGKTRKLEPADLDTRKPNGPAKLEGLVHISEISWEKVDDLTKLFQVGDEVEVVVIAKDEITGRLNLSIKQLMADPFEKASSLYSKDQKVSGVVARITSYGVFVNLEAGIEGLMHISKIPPNVTFKKGDTVECLIESVDARARKISLVPVVKEKPILYR